jgi:hypothetical protein
MNCIMLEEHEFDICLHSVDASVPLGRCYKLGVSTSLQSNSVLLRTLRETLASAWLVLGFSFLEAFHYALIRFIAMNVRIEEVF